MTNMRTTAAIAIVLSCLTGKLCFFRGASVNIFENLYLLRVTPVEKELHGRGTPGGEEVQHIIMHLF